MRILLLSDIHGNSDALKQVLENAPRHDAVWVLGDLVDYGPEPHVVIDMIRNLKPEIIVRGNHDHAVAFNTDCLCSPKTHELSVYTRENISYKLLSREHIEWLRLLPVRREVSIGDVEIYLVHGSPRNPLYGYFYPDMNRELMKLYLTPSIMAVRPRIVGADIVVVGHTHIVLDIMVDSVRVINPGSVGQPRDGDNRASYAILDLDKKEFISYRVKYPVENTLRKLRSLEIEEKYYKWLERILLNARV